MGITITDDIFAATEQLLCLSPVQWGCRYRDTRTILCRRLAEPEFVPEQHARARALIDRIDMALRDRECRRSP